MTDMKPVCRKRVFIIAVRLDGSVTGDEPKNANQFFESVGALLAALKTPPLPLQAVLLPKDHEYIENELQRRQESRSKLDEKIKSKEVQTKGCWELYTVYIVCSWVYVCVCVLAAGRHPNSTSLSINMHQKTLDNRTFLCSVM